MRILNCFLDNRFGGPQRRASSIAEELRSYKIETLFLFNEKSKGNIPIKGFKSFLIKYTQCIRRESTLTNFCLFCLVFPYNLHKICKIIRSEKIDILHTNGVTNFLPVFAGRLMRIKILWHLNDTMNPWIIKKVFLPFVNFLSTKIAIASEKVGFYYFKNNNQFWDKSVILYAPADIKKFNPDLIDSQKIERLKEIFHISSSDFVIGTIGNINISKGYEYFIEAANIVKKKEKKAKFIIVGSRLDNKIYYYRRILDLIQLFRLEKDVILAGFRENIPEMLSMFDVFVLSSVNEACPIAVLEALAMKVPVVATNVGGVSELIINNESGKVVEPCRPDLLADSILEITHSSKEDLEKMVSNGLKRAKEMFSLDIITRKHKGIYEEILLI